MVTVNPCKNQYFKANFNLSSAPLFSFIILTYEKHGKGFLVALSLKNCLISLILTSYKVRFDGKQIFKVCVA